MQFLALAIFSIAVIFLLCTACNHKLFKHYTVAKTAASCGFIAVAVASFFVSDMQQTIYFAAMVFCFILCLTGDVLLGLANKHGKYFSSFFIKGIISFACAHLGFVIIFSFFTPRITFLDVALPIFAVCTTYFCTKHKFFRFNRMKYPAVGYSFFVGLACARGIATAFALGNLQGLLIALGGIFFLVSDASILFLYFTVKKPRKYMRLFNLLTYYIAMLLFALSCGV